MYGYVYGYGCQGTGSPGPIWCGSVPWGPWLSPLPPQRGETYQPRATPWGVGQFPRGTLHVEIGVGIAIGIVHGAGCGLKREQGEGRSEPSSLCNARPTYSHGMALVVISDYSFLKPRNLCMSRAPSHASKMSITSWCNTCSPTDIEMGTSGERSPSRWSIVRSSTMGRARSFKWIPSFPQVMKAVGKALAVRTTVPSA